MGLLSCFFALLLGIWYLSVVLNNILDWRRNYQLVGDVIAMRATPLDGALIGRAILSPFAHKIAFATLVLWELLCAGAFLRGAQLGISDLYWGRAASGHWKEFIFVGVGMGLAVWLFGFITVGGQWFCSWRTPLANGIDPAFRMIVCHCFLAVMTNAA